MRLEERDFEKENREGMKRAQMEAMNQLDAALRRWMGADPKVLMGAIRLMKRDAREALLEAIKMAELSA